MNMEYRSKWGSASFPAALSATGFFIGATIVAFLVIVASFLPSVPAAQAQTPSSTRLELMTVDDLTGRLSHKWSDDGGASWSTWVDLGAPDGHRLYSRPALVSDYAGRLHVIVQSSGLWQITYNQGWSGWTKVPGQDLIHIGGIYYDTRVLDPVITSWAPGRLDLFAFGWQIADGQEFVTRLLHTWTDNLSWSGQWEDLGPVPVDNVNTLFPPAAVSSGPGRIDVFLAGNDNYQLQHKWFANGRWSGWENKGGPPGGLTSAPTVSSPGPGLLTIYARGTSVIINGLSYGWLWGINLNGSWSDWYTVDCCLSGDVFTSVAALALPGAETDVFVLGVGHELWRKAYVNAVQGWLDWQLLDPLYLSNIAATAWVPVPVPLPPPPPPPKCGPTTGTPCPATP